MGFKNQTDMYLDYESLVLALFQLFTSLINFIYLPYEFL